jgi:Family of unknown function (DUF6188)
MYGLDTSIDLSFLKGREMIQIAIGIHQVIFAFDQETRISIESEFRLVCRGGGFEWKPGMPEAAAPSVRLLGAAIERVDGQKDGTLVLGFSTGDSLTVLDNSKEYESYTITRRGETIVV